MLVIKKAMEESKSEGPKKPEMVMDSLDNEGKHAAAKEIIEAVRSNSHNQLVAALESFISMCKHSEEKEEMDY